MLLPRNKKKHDKFQGLEDIQCYRSSGPRRSLEKKGSAKNKPEEAELQMCL